MNMDTRPSAQIPPGRRGNSINVLLSVPGGIAFSRGMPVFAFQQNETLIDAEGILLFWIGEYCDYRRFFAIIPDKKHQAHQNNWQRCQHNVSLQLKSFTLFHFWGAALSC